MKNSFSLLEIILTLIISSIIIIYTTLFSKEILLENKNAQEIEIDKINFLASKVFIEKHKTQIDKITFSNNTLYFDNSVLLKDVKEFSLNSNNTNLTIFINLKDKLIQTWEFKL